ncbi:MAG: type II secretion system minor pseudopilin GspJ [Gammaproteobacteria bacterium]|nr:type II secretion system minor pseudopilin GspJ [Gammaproteobacteria bacterium]MBU1724993.1 type II secretion system minor pseudopilin GspJ [Gammaproteobacteria bacterium]MBU2005081.1 type II secretion system minor pseudopilin GspJ [Gammaproteobacteria bacterium]
MRCSRGFTLLELMIALAVFAVMVTLSYSSVTLLLDANRRTESRQAGLQQLQRAMLFLERDVHQVLDRRANEGYGKVSPALYVPDDNGALLELTRGGNPDMAWQLRASGQMRSALQRVRYVLDGENLIRQSWNLVDHADSQQPVSMALLDGVKSVKFRFGNEKQEWQDGWDEEAKVLPKTLEITLEHTDFGGIKRVFLIYL